MQIFAEQAVTYAPDRILSVPLLNNYSRVHPDHRSRRRSATQIFEIEGVFLKLMVFNMYRSLRRHVGRDDNLHLPLISRRRRSVNNVCFVIPRPHYTQHDLFPRTRHHQPCPSSGLPVPRVQIQQDHQPVRMNLRVNVEGFRPQG